MNKKWAISIAAVLLLGGCAGASPDAASIESASDAPTDSASVEADQIAPEDIDESIAALVAEAPTGSGEICDIKSLYTVDCHIQYPEVAYLNGITRLGGEPLISMTDAEKIELGQQACEQLRAGTARESVVVVDGAANIEGGTITNSSIVVGVAVPSFCKDQDTSGQFN